MRREITSKQMAGVTELTVVANIKPGLVDVRETRTYATRLRILLRTLSEIRRKGIEESIDGRPVGPLERLQFLHFVRFSIFDNDQKLMLAVTFDGAWEPYIRKIADVAGSLLDVIFCNCEGYDGHSTDEGYEKFAEWVREHQVEADFFFAGSPGTSVNDLRYLKKLEEAQREGADDFENYAARLRVGDPDDDARRPSTKRSLEALLALHKLTELYPDPVNSSATSRDHLFLRRTARMILKGIDFADLSNTQRELHARPLEWHSSFEPPPPLSRGQRDEPNPASIQGNILNNYEGMTHGCLLLMRLGDDPSEASAFLKKLQVTTMADKQDKHPVALNIGFTYAGLQALGMPDEELEKLPKEFREGMEARAGWLGDLGPNHPERWQLPKANWPIPRKNSPLPDLPDVRMSTVDFVIQLQTSAKFTDDDHLWSEQHPLYGEVDKLVSRGGAKLLAVEPLRRKPKRGEHPGRAIEHFGFWDGLSQPTHEPHGPERDRVSLGELLLGYPDDHGDEAAAPLDVLDEGTFLVIRKLRQDVAAFNEFLEKNGEQLAGKMMGRGFDGVPLVDPTRNPLDNAFDYAGDPDGKKCPFHAHIRRANPRNGPKLRHERTRDPKHVPRIVRRGFSYGTRFEEDEQNRNDERGLFFMAYNASIADQFEVIQRWISGGNSTGVLGIENDPLLGLPEPGKSRILRVHDEKGNVCRYDMGPRPFVTLEWGMYLFVPSKNAVETLASYLKPNKRPDTRLVVKGEKVIRKLEMLLEVEKLRDKVEKRDPSQAAAKLTLQWKKLIEDLSARDTAKAVWAAVRENRRGVLRTPYGILVGSAQHCLEVFGNHKDFSVRGYWHRMDQSLGALYLGMDPDPQKIASNANAESKHIDKRYRAAVSPTRYSDESLVPNRWIASIDDEAAYNLARAIAAPTVSQLRGRMPDEVLIDVRRFVQDILARMSTKWFAIPDDVFMKTGGLPPILPNAPAHCPHDFGAAARYIFDPNPTDFVKKEGQARGQLLLRATTDYVKKTIKENNIPPNTLFASLHQAMKEGGGALDFDLLARVLVGSVHGFVAPVGGSCISLLYQWIKTEELWRYQQSLLTRKLESPKVDDYARAKAVLGPVLPHAMQVQPVPYILHRTAVRDTTIGPEPVAAGERVVIGIVSGTQDQPGKTELLFGGDYGSPGVAAPVHACPGQQMAMGTILGIVSTLLEEGSLRPRGPLTLSLKNDS